MIMSTLCQDFIQHEEYDMKLRQAGRDASASAPRVALKERCDALAALEFLRFASVLISIITILACIARKSSCTMVRSPVQCLRCGLVQGVGC